MEYSDEKWAEIAPFIPPEKNIQKDKATLSSMNPELFFKATAHKLPFGCRWKDLPDTFPPYQTVHRTFQKWREAGVFIKMVQTLGEKLFGLGNNPDR